MPTRVQTGALIAVAASAWAVTLWLRGAQLSLDYLWPFGTAVSAAGGVAFLFDRWVWRVGFLHGWFTKQPDLRGTWRAVVESSWENPATLQSKGIITAYMGVEQTYSTLRMHLMTPESESWLVAYGMEPSRKTDGYQVAAVYQNQPKNRLRGDQSEIHFGTFVLDTHGPRERPTTLEGEYWTDRGTRGRLRLEQRYDRLLTRFEDGREKIG